MTMTAAPPLAGLRAVELASNFAGPGAGMYLADYGVDVVKVELPGGDPARRFPPHVQGTDIGKPFLAVNRGKRSAVIDWRQADGLPILDRLIARADIVIVDQPVGPAAGGWPLAYERLSALNARLVYGALTPYGERGPYAGMPAYDPLVQALAGIMVVSLSRDGEPTNAGVQVGNGATPMLLANGIMMALLARQRTGRGQRVDTSMLQASVAMQSVQMVIADDDPTPPAEAAMAAYSTYRCGDGRYVNINAIQERQWNARCHVLGLDHLIGDPEYTGNAARGRRRGELFPLMEGVFGTRPLAEWLVDLQREGVPCGPSNRRSELFDDPQVVLNGTAAAVQHPQAGRVEVLGSPIRFSATPVRPGSRVPDVGEHTREVLAEAGLPDAEISGLASRCIIN